MLLKELHNLLEGTKRFTATDVSHEPDGYMVLVRSSGTMADDYYGVNVLFDKNKNFTDFSTADKQADDEAKKYKDEIIAIAKKELK